MVVVDGGGRVCARIELSPQGCTGKHRGKQDVDTLTRTQNQVLSVTYVDYSSGSTALG